MLKYNLRHQSKLNSKAHLDKRAIRKQTYLSFLFSHMADSDEDLHICNSGKQTELSRTINRFYRRGRENYTKGLEICDPHF
jgi:hypothetical protein